MSYTGILEILQSLRRKYRREKVEDPLGKTELVTMNIHTQSQKEEVKRSYGGG